MNNNRDSGLALLLPTKLYIPAARTDLVQRSRLTSQLNESLQRRLTLISAPAGFGKTTLLGEWIPTCANQLLQNYAIKLLAAFPPELVPAAVQTHKTSIGLPASYLVDPLSERELEILKLVANGFSNQAIGRKLFVATSTVKRHINNIYAKLGVHSRTQAVAKGQELKVLAD